MKKVWIVGAMGHIGQALMSLLDVREYELFETDIEDVDISDQGQVMRFVQLNRPEVVINCAGYNRVKPGEAVNEDRFYSINAVGARNLAQAAESIQAKLIQLSTDDVFSKPAARPYNEFEQTAPESVFGKSKYAGECFVRELVSRHVIIRSSWIYGIGKDFVRDVLTAAVEGKKELVLEDDSIAVPTSARELARFIKLFIDEEHYGIYHAVCQGEPCSRQEFARTILEYAGMEGKMTVSVKEGATRRYSALDNMMLRITGLPLPADWREVLKEYLGGTGEIE